MDIKQIKNSLHLKKVELKHLKQFNELLRYVFQVTDSDIEEGGYEDESEIIRAKRPVLREADVYGWFTQDDRLISQLAIYPCEVNIHDKVYKMAGVTGVGTYPEFTNLGLMSELIKQGLEKCVKMSNGFLIFIHTVFPTTDIKAGKLCLIRFHLN